MVRLNVTVPKEVAEALGHKCVKERRSLSDGVTAAVKLWLGK